MIVIIDEGRNPKQDGSGLILYHQSIKFIFAMLVIKQQEKYNTKLETKTKQCAGRLRVDLTVYQEI